MFDNWGDSLIKVGTDVRAQALGISVVNFSRALGFWHFLTRNV